MKSTFARHVTLLAAGSTIAQALSILASPVLTRLFSPADFGVLSVFLASISTLSVISAWRYDVTVVLTENEDDAANLMILSSLAMGISSMLVLIAIAMLDLLATDQTWIWWLPLTIPIVGANLILRAWTTRQTRYAQIARARVAHTVLKLIVQVGAGVAGFGAMGLIIGQVLGETIETLTLGFQVWRAEKNQIIRRFTWHRTKALARRYVDFPKYTIAQNLISQLSRSSATFLLAYFFGTTIAGYYALAERLLVLPNNLIGNSVRQVFLQRASKDHNAGLQIIKVWKKTVLSLAIIGIWPTLAILLAGPFLFSTVLGDEWHTAGVYARWLALWVFIRLLNSPHSAVIEILNKLRFLLRWNIWQLVFRVIAISVGAYYDSPLAAIILYSVVGFMFSSILYGRTWLFLRQAGRANHDRL